MELIIKITETLDLSYVRSINKYMHTASMARFCDSIKFNDKSIDFLLQTYHNPMIFYSMDIYVEPSNHANNETDHGSATIIYNNTLQKSFEFFEETLDCHRIYYGEMVNIRDHIDIKSHKNYIDSWADEWTDVIDVTIIDIDLIAFFNLLKSAVSLNIAKARVINYLNNMYNKLSYLDTLIDIIYINMWFVTNAIIMNVLPAIHDIINIIDVPFYDSEDDEYVEFHMERADSHPVIIAKKVKLKDECYELYPQLMDKIHLLCY